MRSSGGGEWLPLLLAAVLGATQDTRPRGAGGDWSWSWSCESGLCVRAAVPGAAGNPRGSMQLCSLTCGRYGALWPRPTGETVLNSQLVQFHPGRVQFDLSQVAGGQDARELAGQMTRIFLQNVASECADNITPDPGTEVTVSIATASSNLTLNLDTNETYRLQVATEGSRVSATISAVTLFGARHALETLSQLVACAAVAGGPLLLVSGARVVDEPVFRHRGLLLDTGRNYLPEEAIRRTLDAMAASKLNVLHWHATDSQSFPLQLPRVPQLARFGAYSAKEVYSMEAVARVIQYARERGVRVLLELDAPSHAGNGWQWGEAAGLGALAVCVNQQPWRQYCIQPPCGQLNPINPSLYRVLRELYRDLLTAMAPDEMLHMGGDEVFFPCWNSTAEIVAWMQERGQGRTQEDFVQVWAEFQATALRILDEERGHSNTPTILWSSHLTDPKRIEKYLNKDRYIIETWVESKNTLPKELLSKGYRLIIATKDTWYLDHGFWGTTTYHNWRVVYSNTLPRESGVLGGEVAMWAELVDNNSLDGKVWPRAAAAAERLWSDPTTGPNVAERRLFEHRNRLVRRGVAADAMAPQWCYLHERECL